jgi:putative transposase
METLQNVTRTDAGRPIVTVNETIHDPLAELVRGAVEQTLNQRLEAEADGLCGAKRYAHSTERVVTRAGHYFRSLHTKASVLVMAVRPPSRAIGPSAGVPRWPQPG